jgi:acetylornithine/N-succinyldiaminopimelate aminotransferase
MNNRELFYANLAQTSPNPLALEIVKAEGIYLWDADGKKYIDLISGISVSNVGHRNPFVINAIKEQVDKYLHLMVYGEYIQSPQVKLAKKISDLLPSNLDSVYFVNSGSEAVEGALKLAKKYTNRTEIIAFKNAYHGSSHGALSVMGNEKLKQPFRPLLPDVKFIEFNNIDQLKNINHKTACVIAETIQGEAGAIVPSQEFMTALRETCNKKGTLLILDEIQTGFARTGTMFAFEQFSISPDIMTIAKGFAGGMPLGAFISDKEIMSELCSNPALGHITTFGGHPVSCAAALASIEVIESEKLISNIKSKELLFRKYLKHPNIKGIHGKGLLLALEFENFSFNKKVINHCILNGLIADWFLFADNCLRIAPPLIITEDEIKNACEIILQSIE